MLRAFTEETVLARVLIRSRRRIKYAIRSFSFVERRDSSLDSTVRAWRPETSGLQEDFVFKCDQEPAIKAVA